MHPRPPVIQFGLLVGVFLLEINFGFRTGTKCSVPGTEQEQLGAQLAPTPTFTVSTCKLNCESFLAVFFRLLF